MVYESDYTTRRVYTGSRPIVSTSYSYSPAMIPKWSLFDDEQESYAFEDIPQFFPQHPHPEYILPYYEARPLAALRRPELFMSYSPGIRKGRKQHRVILPVPRMVHQRLIQVSAPPRRHRQTNVYDALEYGRAGNSFVLVNYRPSPPPPRSRVMYIEDVTNSSNMDELNRESRSLSRDLDSMLYRVAYGVPMNSSPYNIHHIPMRSASEVKEIADVRRSYVRDRYPEIGWNPLNKASLYRNPIIHQPDPAALVPKYYYIGRQNLACLSFAGGRPIPKRRRFYPGYDDKVQNDVTFRSFYTKMRNAANSAANAAKLHLRSSALYQPIHYSRKTLFGENPEPKRQIKESKWVERAMANTKEPVPRISTTAPIEIKRPSIKEPTHPKRRESITKEPKPEPPPSGRPINVTLPGPRKSVTEIMKEDLPKVVNLPDESVTVRRPSRISETPATPEIDLEAEETFKIRSAAARQISVKAPTPPPAREPTPEPEVPIEEPTPEPEVQIEEPTPEPEVPIEEPTPEPEAPIEEPTPEPEVPIEEPTPEPEAPIEEPVAVAVEVEASAGAPEEVSISVGAEEGQASEEASNKGEVEDISLDEVCEDPQNDLEIEQSLLLDDEDAPAATPEAAIEVEESIAQEEEQPQTETALEAEVAEPEAQPNTTVEVQEDVQEAPKEEIPAMEEVTIETTPVEAGVSILVADIDGPVQVVEIDSEQRNGEEIMTVEQIQAAAEQRRTEFARLLEEHHEIIKELDKLQNKSEEPINELNKLEPVPEEQTPIPTPTPQEPEPGNEPQNDKEEPIQEKPSQEASINDIPT